jgi:hypothetical protein
MNYTAIKTTCYRTPKGKFITTPVGAEVSEAKYMRMPSATRSSFIPSREYKALYAKPANTKRIHWSVAEHEFAIRTYLEIVTDEGSIPREELRTRFSENYPEREYQGVSHTLHQIRTRDIYTYQGGFTSIPLQLLALMHEIAPERFYVTEEEIAEANRQLDVTLAAALN